MMRSTIASIVFLAACSKQAGNLDELAKIKDELCACKTEDCLADVYGLKYSPWRHGGEIEKPSKEWRKRYDAIMVEFHACYQKVRKLSMQ